MKNTKSKAIQKYYEKLDSQLDNFGFAAAVVLGIIIGSWPVFFSILLISYAVRKFVIAPFGEKKYQKSLEEEFLTSKNEKLEEEKKELIEKEKPSLKIKHETQNNYDFEKKIKFIETKIEPDYKIVMTQTLDLYNNIKENSQKTQEIAAIENSIQSLFVLAQSNNQKLIKQALELVTDINLSITQQMLTEQDSVFDKELSNIKIQKKLISGR